MKQLRFDSTHKTALAMYGLENITQDACRVCAFEPGETITELGSEISCLYIVIEGRAKVFRLVADGKSLIICQYISDGIIGELELLTGQALASSTVKAISTFICVAIPYTVCRKELQNNIRFSNSLNRILAEKLTESANNFVSAALRTGEQRLCLYILQNANGKRFCDNLTEVAASTGMSYRHMFRILNDLCERKVLQKDHSGFTVLNMAELERAAKKG